MTNEEIKQVTDNAKQICLVGIRHFEEDIQQFTCKFINGEYCSCHKLYEEELNKYKISSQNETLI